MHNYRDSPVREGDGTMLTSYRNCKAHIYTLSEIMHSGFPHEGSWQRSAQAARNLALGDVLLIMAPPLSGYFTHIGLCLLCRGESQAIKCSKKVQKLTPSCPVLSLLLPWQLKRWSGAYIRDWACTFILIKQLFQVTDSCQSLKTSSLPLILPQDTPGLQKCNIVHIC